MNGRIDVRMNEWWDVRCSLSENTIQNDGVRVCVCVCVCVQESSGNDKFLIDGFPRNPENLDGWNK